VAADLPVALISGTSRGIGNHLARHFLARDYAVIGCSRSQPDGIDDPNYAHHVIDVGSEPEVVELFRLVRRDYGHLEVAISNAACNSTLSLAVLTAGVAADEVLQTNVLGTFLWCREAIKLMMRRGYGRIVNLGSVATRYEVPGEALYTASKAAVNAMTRVLAKETAQHGITCNMVAPAAVETDTAAALDPVRVRALLERNAFHSMGSMEEISDTVDWLVSSAGSAITGQLIYLGGA
jgi:3-oxoacyl-[acyl-carrier protein] reductase